MSKIETVLFISNETFVNFNNKEGGVQLCTSDFISLLREKYEVIIFPVKYRYNLFKRLTGKFGLNNYNDYNIIEYKKALKNVISEKHIKYVFLNLSNTMRFAELLKNMFPFDIKVIVCSHGNETGDYIHEVVKFKAEMPWYSLIFSSYNLGSRIKIESEYRQKFIDMVLNVSPVEDSIEKWIGCRNTFMVPRTVNIKFIDLKPVEGRVGFIGDLSHWPNKFGIFQLCTEIEKLKISVNLILVGTHKSTGENLAKRFPFITYLGFLPNDLLEKEVKTWAFFLNPVFYYSKGVSTKLAKALGWGLPVISTSAGLRGYQWTNGSLVIAKDASDMARLIGTYTLNMDRIVESQCEVKKISKSSPTYASIMEQLFPILENL